MSRKSKILGGLDEALEHANGKRKLRVSQVRVPSNVDVARIRRKLNLSQGAFARQFGFSVSSVRNWEQKARIPEGPARILLTVIDLDPDAVIKALSPK